MQAIAFDVYGTLIDPFGITDILEQLVGDKAQLVSDTWRQQQISYSFRRTLINQFAPFSVCTRDALSYACQRHGVRLQRTEFESLLRAYTKLPAYPEVVEKLEQLHAQQFSLYAFSNGAQSDLEALFQHAGISSLFTSLISVDAVRRFKPHPAVYQHLRSSVREDRLHFISANPFDVQGALQAGLDAIWLQRNADAVYDPWGPQPTQVIHDLSALATA